MAHDYSHGRLRITIMNPETKLLVAHRAVDSVAEAKEIVRKHFPEAVFKVEDGLFSAEWSTRDCRTVATCMMFARRGDSIVGLEIPEHELNRDHDDPTDWRNWTD
jgi:hypothetical protein